MSSQAVEDDALVKATRATEALYLVRDTYFPANPDDKIAKLNAESDLALSLLDSIPPGNISMRPFHFTFCENHLKSCPFCVFELICAFIFDGFSLICLFELWRTKFGLHWLK